MLFLKKSKISTTRSAIFTIATSSVWMERNKFKGEKSDLTKKLLSEMKFLNPKRKKAVLVAKMKKFQRNLTLKIWQLL
jgi:hypothetical protein